MYQKIGVRLRLQPFLSRTKNIYLQGFNKRNYVTMEMLCSKKRRFFKQSPEWKRKTRNIPKVFGRRKTTFGVRQDESSQMIYFQLNARSYLCKRSYALALYVDQVWDQSLSSPSSISVTNYITPRNTVVLEKCIVSHRWYRRSPFLWKPTVHYHIDKILPSDYSKPFQSNPYLHILFLYNPFQYYPFIYDQVSQVVPFFDVFPLTCCMHLSFPHAC